MKLSRPAIFVTVVAAIVLVIGVLGALLLPRIVDSQMIRDRIDATLPKGFEKKLVIGKIVFLWFPRPSLILENTELSFGDKGQGSIGAVKIYPSLVSLFLGRLVVRRALLLEPTLNVRLSAHPERPLDIEDLEKQIGSALLRLTKELPARHIDLSGGSAEIRIGDKPPVRLHDVSAQTAASPQGVRFEVSARSNLWLRLTIEGKISPRRLAAQLDIGVQRLKIEESFAFLPLQISEYMRQGEASFDLKIASVGLRRVKASIGGFAEPLVLARHGGTATLAIKRLKGALTYEGGAFQVDVERLDLSSPRLKASGQLKIHADSLSARLKAHDVDIAEVGLALQMIDDAEGVKKILRYVPAGTISEMIIHSAGRSFAEMTSSENFIASGRLQNSTIFIPGPNLELKNVTAALGLAGNNLQADNISANLGAMQGRNGVLRLGLEGGTAPFHLDMSVHTGAPELLSVLLKVVRDEGVRAQLLKLRKVDGELSGRLILGETIDAISPVVAISNVAISAEYEPVPFPITIRTGRLNYDQKIITVEHAHGELGGSRFGGLGLTLSLDGSRRIKIDSKRTSLDLQQAETLLRSFKDLRSRFEKLRSLRGRIELENIALTGAYDDPARWNFATTGAFDQVEIQHFDFPGGLVVSRGKFDANERRILLSDAAAAISDAALSGAGRFEYPKGEPVRFEISGRATVGEQMTPQLSRYIELPKDVRLRSPLQIVTERLAWAAGGDISFLGQLDVAGGTLLSVDAVKRPQELAIKNLTVDDDDRRARMTFQLAQDHLDLSFNGEVTQQTFDKLFTSFPMKVGSLQGDIKVSAALADPVGIFAAGQLSGSNLSVPLGADKALLENFTIQARGDNAQVRSADLRLGSSRLLVEGNIGAGKEALRLDLDVAADRLSLETLDGLFGAGDQRRNETVRVGLSLPRAQGTIRLKADSFAIDRFTFSPLQIHTAISSSSIRAEIERGVVCGINTTGRLEAAGNDIGIDLQLSATDADLEPTTVCLTNQQSNVRGTYSFAARIAGRGGREHLRSALKGNFQLSARDGEFVRSAGIDVAFEYLNGSGDFAVKFPDLNEQAFAYRMLSARGKIDGENIYTDEIIIQAAPLTVTGQGSLDLQRNQVHMKGLVSVALPTHQVIKRIPLIGAAMGGSLVGIPIRIAGSLERPDVTYLSPADIGGELLRMPMRILGMPLDAIKLFVPGDGHDDKNIIR